MEDSYSIRLTEYARVTQQLLYTVLSSKEILTEEAKVCVEASLLLSSFALNEQRERATANIVIILVRVNDILGNLFFLYEEALAKDDKTGCNHSNVSRAEAMLKELILNYEAILSLMK